MFESHKAPEANLNNVSGFIGHQSVVQSVRARGRIGALGNGL